MSKQRTSFQRPQAATLARRLAEPRRFVLDPMLVGLTESWRR